MASNSFNAGEVGGKSVNSRSWGRRWSADHTLNGGVLTGSYTSRLNVGTRPMCGTFSPSLPVVHDLPLSLEKYEAIRREMPLALPPSLPTD